MTRAPLIIFGAGGHAKVAIDATRARGLKVALVLDDHFAEKEFLGIPVSAKIPAKPFRFLVAIGNNMVRAEIFERLKKAKGTPTSILHPGATVSPLAEIGAGTMVVAGAVINAGARIGNNCVINTCASVDHDCQLADHVFIAPGARLCGTVSVGAGSSIFTGAIVIPGIKIGKNCVINAGAVVTRDVPDGAKIKRQ